MTLSAGAKLGPYEILSPLGAGGMGEVYRAKDTKLDRDVAIKILPDPFARDPERVARFQREAKVLASLNHPNIAAIYGLEEAEKKTFLVLELVEGDTLAQRLKTESMAVEEALDIGRQIAEGLEAAHASGVIHRDLKPANVKITPDGQVKVLDFGLAKAFSGDSSSAELANSPTITADFTRPGVVLGTAAYMSPEQARGRPLDKRTDIWSFGSVLFECLAGGRPFEGETATDLIARILERDPQWNDLPAETPPTIQLLLRRCLAKDRNRRLRDIGDARVELEDAIADPSSTSLRLAGSALAEARRRPRRKGSALLVALGLLLAAAAGSYITTSFRPEPPLRKFATQVEDLQKNRGLAISPDGKKIVYVADDRLWIRDIDRLTPRELPGTKEGRNPFWSPDSAHIGYMTQRKLWKTSIHGGTSVIGEMPQGATDVAAAGWGSDGKIVFATGNGALYEVSAQGGDPRTLLELDHETEGDFHDASLLPNGRGALFVIHPKGVGANTIALLSGSTKTILLHQERELFFTPVYSPTGHILYHRGRTTPGIWALPFSLSKLEVTGEPFLVKAGAQRPSVSQYGTLTYFDGSMDTDHQLVWVNRIGKVDSTIGPAQSAIWNPVLSPDGKIIAVDAESSENQDVWLIDVTRQTRTRFTFGSSREFLPIWHPDGLRLAYTSEVGKSRTCFLKSVDGTGEPKELSSGYAVDFTKDGKYVILVRTGKDAQDDIWYMTMEGEKEAVAFLDSPADEDWLAISPDGKFLAYESDETGRDEIYIKPFPGGGGKWQASVDGGRRPLWSKNGDELFFTRENDLYALSVQSDPDVVLGAPQKLFGGTEIGVSLIRRYDVDTDGKRFVVVQTQDPEDEDQLNNSFVVVENWFAEFKDRR